MLVWVAGGEGDQRLHTYDGDTGTVIYSGGGADEMMLGTRKWNTGIVARGRIYYPADNKIYAFVTPGGVPTPTPTPTPHCQQHLRDSYCDSNVNAICYSNTSKYALCVHGKDCPPWRVSARLAWATAAEGDSRPPAYAGAAWKCHGGDGYNTSEVGTSD